MPLRVINGALSWEGATVQISNLADIRRYHKRYVRIIPPPHTQERIRFIGRLSLFVSAFYLLHFYFKTGWRPYWHILSLIIGIGGLILYIKWKKENKNAPKEESIVVYFVSIEKNSGSKEYFTSTRRNDIDLLYQQISDVMHKRPESSVFNFKSEYNVDVSNSERPTFIMNSFNEYK